MMLKPRKLCLTLVPSFRGLSIIVESLHSSKFYKFISHFHFLPIFPFLKWQKEQNPQKILGRFVLFPQGNPEKRAEIPQRKMQL